MEKRTVVRAALMLLASGTLAGCAGMEDPTVKYWVDRHSVQSFEVPTVKLRGDSAFSTLTAIFVERGFDIKTSNKEAGLVTTEYKKFAAAGSSPPFDYYLQLRATIRDAGSGKTVIRLVPMVKEQNRVNSAAFTERELYYHVGRPEGVRAADKEGWVETGRVTFLNIVGDLTQRAGAQDTDIVKNTTVVRYNTLLGPPRQ